VINVSYAFYLRQQMLKDIAEFQAAGHQVCHASARLGCALAGGATFLMFGVALASALIMLLISEGLP
jgi:hypothetical protein